MEICKVFLLANYQKENPDAQMITLLFFGQPSAEKGIQIFADGKAAGIYPHSEEMYMDVTNLFSPVLKDIRAEEPIVDRKWALNVIHTTRNN